MSPQSNIDVVIVGAGAAGLSAAHGLAELDLDVVILEARDRIGGRVHTVHDDAFPLPVELGAEFIHGKPDVLMAGVYKSALAIQEAPGEPWIAGRNGPEQSAEVENAWQAVSAEMRRIRGPDRTFDDFLEESQLPSGRKHLATKYVEGFHAADPAKASVQSLVVEQTAADRSKGNRLFRLRKGFSALLQWYARNSNASIRLNSWVRKVQWEKGTVRISFTAADSQQEEWIGARAAIVTVPLPVLQREHTEGGIHFEPDVPDKRAAARRLEMGQVVRIVFCFTDRVWEKAVPDLGFLFCPSDPFPTWWTSSPEPGMITAWAGGPDADRLLRDNPDQRTAVALSTLSRVVGVPVPRLRTALRGHRSHDWSRDPLALGAYSYTPVNALQARRELANPVEGTLFFAGEAAVTTGDHGTVHGALASGYLTARKVVEAISK